MSLEAAGAVYPVDMRMPPQGMLENRAGKAVVVGLVALALIQLSKNGMFDDFSGYIEPDGSIIAVAPARDDKEQRKKENKVAADEGPYGGEWQSPIDAKDLRDRRNGISQCWMNYYGPKDGHHAAVDFRVVNKPVRAPKNGVIVEDYAGRGAENTFIIDTGPDAKSGKPHIYAVFMHMASFKKRSGTVEAGEVIGMSGSAGTRAPHLHYGISDNIRGRSYDDFGTYDNPWHTANPVDYMPDNVDPALTRSPSGSCKTDALKKRGVSGLKLYKQRGTFGEYR